MSLAHKAYLQVASVGSSLDEYVVERQLRKLGLAHARHIPTHTTLAELHALFRLAQGCPENAVVLEIGSYLGASTCYLAAGVSQYGGKVICVDTWMNETMPEGPRDTLAEFRKNTAPVSQWLQIVRKRSKDLVEEDISKPVHLVFIDGNHNYETVKIDFRFAANALALDGAIAFHDVRDYLGVSRVVGEALAGGEWLLAGHINNLCWLSRAPQSWAIAGTVETI
jgi:predicted O-methyltransferase YrrM